MTVDNLYDHTHDPADIDLTMTLLRRAAGHQNLSRSQRRRILISIAIQYSNLGASKRAAQGRSGPGTESWTAFEAAIGQFREVLAELGKPARWVGRTDHGIDRLDAWTGLLETYYQRGGDRALDGDLDAMAVAAREVVTGMTANYRLRAYALGRCGVLLIERIARRIGDPWDLALSASISAMRSSPISDAVTAVPGFDTDLDLAMWTLTESARLGEPTGRQALFTAAACMAHALRYLAYFRDEDLYEIGRLCRIVMGHSQLSPVYRRQCGEWLLVVLTQRIWLAGASPGSPPQHTARRSPSADASLDVMIGLLAGFAADDETRIAPALSALLSEAVLLRAEGDLSDSELGAMYTRRLDAAAALADVPVARAALLFQAAMTGAEWVRHGTGPDGLADQVAAAFQEALRGFPPTHPIARDIAARAAAFGATRGASAATSAPQDGATADQPPPNLDVFDVRALASLGVASHGRLAVPAGRAAEVARTLLDRPLQSAQKRAAIRSVLALASYAAWVRERAHADLASAFEHIRAAIGLLPDGHPLRVRLVELLAGMLLDRAQVGGDLADTDAALALLADLLDRAGAGPGPDGLNPLLAAAGPPALSELLTVPPGRAGGAAYRLGLMAAMGSGQVLRGILAGGVTGPLGGRLPTGAAEDLATAVSTLRQVAGNRSIGDTRRLDVLSDLGLALLASGEEGGHHRAALETLREAASAAAGPPVHPRRAAILLRTAAALIANERAAGDSEAVDESIALLQQALPTAGPDAFGERSRCLYGLGFTLLMRYSHTHRTADLSLAVRHLEEARAGLEAMPGDPFVVPLLRALAWAHRREACRHGETDAPRLPRHRSRSAGRAVLYGHAQSVLLQSGSPHGLSASRSIGLDALTLAEWCLADGKIESAVEALELGRALVLHAATVAADVLALLREAGRPDLAAEWNDQLVRSTHGAGDGIAGIPSDLRRRVLTALQSGAAEQHMLAAPTVAQITVALRVMPSEGLVYLIPASGRADGRAVIVGADGQTAECRLPGLSIGDGTPVARFAEAHHDLRTAQAADNPDTNIVERFREELNNLCDWAWTAVIHRLLDRFANPPSQPVRLVIVPTGILGIVPWHAARYERSGRVRYACQEAVFTTCASARQLIETAARPRLPIGAGPAVFVANPGRDENLQWSEREAEAISAALYPHAVYLGRSTRTAVDGPGSADEVLACLSAGGLHGIRPAVLHLGCHAMAGDSPEESHLELAAKAKLPVSRILAQAWAQRRDSPGGLVVLAACTSDLTVSDYDEALTLSSAFLASGAAGVVGSRWVVSDLYTALLMFMMHRHLVRNPEDNSADALRAAQLWMLDPERKAPAEMPAPLSERARRTAASHPHAWAAFTCHGQ
jgi:hypothetical protein